MDTSKHTHTPGPLTVLPNYFKDTIHRHAIAANHAPPGRKLPAIVDTVGNATLYAAAPDLLAACKAAENFLAYGDYEAKTAAAKAALANVAEVLDAAIAKAESCING